ncbi:hypothetical protein CIG2463D_0941 [Campylobacter iguaniorum]|uniref:Uncharacterized protein n=1 Tax=Campylobacter iguaniorum TaxID=1244531 RepID=A0A076FG39_9BACT|nr:hypothetical protein [Campylobacter iguaniorum]AII14779.1 hypothetical protein CIG1485E_0941 [Campylobacter iguaniorum]ALV24514.1 hypothetical protein CIG2463D_0941 [Campylobacter iguaniorum]
MIDKRDNVYPSMEDAVKSFHAAQVFKKSKADIVIKTEKKYQRDLNKYLQNISKHLKDKL